MDSPTASRSYLASLAREAEAQTGVPADIARYAASATLRALGGSKPAGERQQKRLSAYFWAVVRRRLVSRGGTSMASARFVLSAVVEDLMQAGRDSGDVWRELQRGWADRVPPEVLEEYRLRLCA